MSTRTVSRLVGGAPVKVPPMIGVPLVFFLMTTSWGMGLIQYLVSEVCFTTWYLNFEAAVVGRVGERGRGVVGLVTESLG